MEGPLGRFVASNSKALPVFVRRRKEHVLQMAFGGCSGLGGKGEGLD